ncbi:hypothetical protein [Priestia megaterium]|nr:hypothetical protein [Priestia megaterium]
MKNKYKLLKEDWILVLVVLAIISTNIALQGYFKSLDSEFWFSLIPNFIADAISVLLSAYVITRLIQKGEERRAKEKVYKALGKRLDALNTKVAEKYIHFITKKPTKESEQGLTNQVKDLSNNIELYVTSNFVREEIKVFSYNPSQPTDIFNSVTEEMWSYQKFCYFFKKQLKESLDEFINRYISLLPEDLRENLFIIDDLLMTGIFVTPLEFGVELDISNAQIKEEDFQKVLSELGEEIYKLMNYFQEFKGDKNV